MKNHIVSARQLPLPNQVARYLARLGRKHMQTTSRAWLLLLAFSFAITSLSAIAQVVTATVPVEGDPAAIAVNPVTNKIYAANYCGNDPTCNTHYGTVTVIDGKTLSTDTVAVGIAPYAVVVNSVTNKIYVVNLCGSDPTCQSRFNQTLTVIDGTTLSTVTLTVGFAAYFVPTPMAINPVTNKIYVVNGCGNDPTCTNNGTVTVIDGATNLIAATVRVGTYPDAVAVNSVTNEIYIANSASNNVTVIDGATNAIFPPPVSPVPVDTSPAALAINELTNQIYVVNQCGHDYSCRSNGTVTVINAVNNVNTTTSVPIGAHPGAVALNPVTNKIYVANLCGYDPTCRTHQETVTAMDGITLATPTFSVGFDQGYVADPVAVNPVTNKIYVLADCGNDPNCQSASAVTVIDGTTNSTVMVPVGSGSFGMAMNLVANRVYVSNQCGNAPTCDLSVGPFSGTVSVIAGAPPTALQFVAVTPCRVVDTRSGTGQFGGPPIQGQTYRSFPLPEGICNIPSSAAAYSLNVTAVPQGPLGYLTVWPSGQPQPSVSTLNSLDGRIKANAAIVQAGANGAISVYATNTTNVVVDINGYFAPVSSSTLAFYPLAPCRVADTRKDTFPSGLGSPHLSAMVERDFPVRSSSCNIPDTAQAYSFNFTAVPYPALGYPLGYLEVWPKDQKPQHPVSTLNNLTGTIVANAAIVPAGTGGEITVLANNDTDLVIDIDGYFAPGCAYCGSLSLYPAAPCRVLDTRLSGGAFSGEINPAVDVVDSSCGVPSTAEAYVFSVTVVPQGPLGYLTLWPDGQNHPLASTLNALDGAITSNMAILQNFDGETNAYASGVTQLILDISSYFAP